MIYWADTNDSFKSVIDKFQEETGNTINYEVAPADYLEWQQLMTTRFASGDKGTDAFHCDDFQAAIYGAAGWLTPLEPTVEKYSIDLSDWPQTLQGKAKEFFDRYQTYGKPQGYKLKAMIINFPGGMPGDVGFFLNWAPDKA